MVKSKRVAKVAPAESPKVKLAVMVSEPIRQALSLRAKVTHDSMGNIIEKILQENLKAEVQQYHKMRHDLGLPATA